LIIDFVFSRHRGRPYDFQSEIRNRQGLVSSPTKPVLCNPYPAPRNPNPVPRNPNPATRTPQPVSRFTTSQADKKGEKAFAFSPYSKDYSRLFKLSQL
jgi:hypothetical protein